MKPEKITYQKAFVIGPYLQDKVGIEAFVNEGETIAQALTRAKKEIDEWHESAWPLLKVDTGLQEPAIIQTEKPSTEDRIAQLIKDIQSCTEVKVLESYKLIAKNNACLRAAYDQQYEKLTT